MLKSLLLSIFLIPLACQAPEQKPELDIVVADEPNVSYTLDWKPYFRPPPAAVDKLRLREQITLWEDSKDLASLIKKARAEAALGFFQKAQASYRQVLRLDPKNAEALLECAQIYLRLKAPEEALELLSDTKLLLDSQERPNQNLIFRYRYTLALAYLSRGERDKGHDILVQLIEKDPSFGPGYAALTQSYIMKGATKNALFTATQGLDRAGNDPSLLNLLAVLAIKERDATKAQHYLNEALKLSPKHAEARTNRARLALERQEYQAAEMELKEVVKDFPTQTEALILLGISQKYLGQFTQAKISFERSLEAQPESAYARYHLALLALEKEQNPAKALRLFTEVLQAKDDSAQDLKELAATEIEALSEQWTQAQTLNADISKEAPKDD